MALNTGHALYANLTRSLKGDPAAPRLLDQTGGTDHTATQSNWAVFTREHLSAVAPRQGIATDGVHWYELNTTTLVKRDFATGALVTSNSSPFTGLPAGVDHIGDGFVDGGLLYVPVVNWDGGTQTATAQTIAVYNTSDLSLNTQFDVSGQSAFNGSGLCKSHNGTIYGTSYYTISTPNSAQSTIHEFNLATGAFIATHTLPANVIGTQGIEWDGTYYLLTSHDLINTINLIHYFDSSLTTSGVMDPTGFGTTASDEIEGICYWEGNLYTHKYQGGIRQFTYTGLYHHPTDSTASQFLTNAQIPDTGTIVIRMRPHTYLNYRTIFDNTNTGNDWEAWIYGSGELAWRVDATARTGYSLGAADTEHLFLFSWSKSGSNVNLQLGVDGTIVDTATTAWHTKPANGLWLGGGNGGNTPADYTYSDVVLYDKALSAAEWTSLAADFDAIYAVEGSVTHEASLSLAASAGLSQLSAADFLASLSLGVSAGDAVATAATLNGALSFGVSAGLAQSAQLVSDALLTLSAQVGDSYNYPSGVVHNASLSLGVSAGDQSGSSADYQAALSLSASLGSALGTQVDWAGGLTLSAQLDDGRTANGTFYASITLAASAGQQDASGLTYNEQITLGAALSDAMAAALLDTTNPHKVFAVQAENRTFSVAVELRTFTVSKD